MSKDFFIITLVLGSPTQLNSTNYKNICKYNTQETISLVNKLMENLRCCSRHVRPLRALCAFPRNVTFKTEQRGNNNNKKHQLKTFSRSLHLLHVFDTSSISFNKLQYTVTYQFLKLCWKIAKSLTV